MTTEDCSKVYPYTAFLCVPLSYPHPFLCSPNLPHRGKNERSAALGFSKLDRMFVCFSVIHLVYNLSKIPSKSQILCAHSHCDLETIVQSSKSELGQFQVFMGLRQTVPSSSFSCHHTHYSHLCPPMHPFPTHSFVSSPNICKATGISDVQYSHDLL